jgi:hypothetical protein
MRTPPHARGLLLAPLALALAGCGLTGKHHQSGGIPAPQRPYVAAADNAMAVIEVVTNRTVRDVLSDQDFYPGAPAAGTPAGTIDEDDVIQLENDVGSGEMDVHLAGSAVASSPTGSTVMTNVFATVTFPGDTFFYLYAADGTLAAQTVVPAGTTLTVTLDGEDDYGATNHNQTFTTTTSYRGVQVTSPVGAALIASSSTGTMTIHGFRAGNDGVMIYDQWAVDANATNTITGLGDILIDQHYTLYELPGVRIGRQAIAFAGLPPVAYDYSLYPPTGSDVPDPLAFGYRF